ncbi:uncharacterized protein LOC106647443 [Copidosoma floridanum]|uniref:uncharacterized protein LOC106647443 n=1 Tax=Copidosoma floridanum TaxID=29053 RepID=UPI0006C946DA|nr:uncharacterized protein LOC106647443 [Copidosoma floridanum]
MMSLCKYFGMLRKERDIRKCVSRMAQDWKDIQDSGERDVMLTIVLPIVLDTIVIGNNTVRPFSFQGYFVFFDPHVSLWPTDIGPPCICILSWVFTLTLESRLCSCQTVAFCSLAILFVLDICGQIAVTTARLRKLADRFDDEALGDIVRKHIKALRYGQV